MKSGYTSAQFSDFVYQTDTMDPICGIGYTGEKQPILKMISLVDGGLGETVCFAGIKPLYEYLQKENITSKRYYYYFVIYIST